MYTVGVRKHGESGWRCVCTTGSRKYALAVARKWRKKGYDAFIEEVQQEEL